MRLAGLIVVTSSTEDLFSCAEMKTWLRRDVNEVIEDELLQGLLDTAIARYQDYTGRVPLKTTFDYALDEAPCGELVLPRYPLVDVSSVKGFSDTDLTDTGGTAMSTSGYYVDTIRTPGRLVPIGGAVYPTGTRAANAFIARFEAGESSVASEVPQDVKTTIQTMIARAYEHRGDEAAMEHAMLSVVGTEANLSPEWG